jgi:acid phosphatase
MHSPYATFDSIADNGTRLANILSFRDFDHDMDNAKVPQFVFISPDMLNDGHNTTLDYATKWADKFLKRLTADDSFSEKTLVQLTFDETLNYGEPNRIVSLLLGSAVPSDLRGSEDKTFYTHYSILSTVENNWELPNLGRYDVGANVFDLVSRVTGYVNKDPPNIATLNNSLSYPGPYNHNHTTKLDKMAAPNLNLVGAGGKPILESIKKDWEKDASETPYDGKGTLYDGNTMPQYGPPSAPGPAPGPA